MTAREYFTIGEAAEILNSSCLPENLRSSRLPSNFRTDSRIVTHGDGFMAIKGAKDDGHDYIVSAINSGASCVLLERGYFGGHTEELSAAGAAFIPVDDTIASAAKLAKAWLREVSPKVIGITGSVGKTTTREFLYDSLMKNFRTHVAIKSYNTLIGASMTILSMPRETDILILELGTNHPGEIRELARHFPVSHGIITEVSDAHLEGLGDIEGVLAAKMEIAESEALEYLSYNSDNELLSAAVAALPKGEKMTKGGIKQIGVGYSNSGVRLSDVRQSVGGDFEPRLFVTLSRGEKKLTCGAPLFGKQHAKNIGFAYAVSVQMGLDDEIFQAAAENFKIPHGRGVIVHGGNGCVLIDETYNANPTSVSFAIKNLLEMEIPEDFKRIAILGGMRELGRESERLHDVVVSRAALFDELYLIGGEWGDARGKYDSIKGIWASTEGFISDFRPDYFKKSVILLKGSRYYGLERLLERLEAEGHDD
jgi:UDP-N-acetylmuramoyl-tripeptide--D-alanyl-D-alanine ligase